MARSNETAVRELLAVATADEMSTAKDYQKLLKENDIPAKVRGESKSGEVFGYELLVPEEYYEDAMLILESHQQQEDFFDYLLGDPDQDFDDEYDDY